jgi:hypothetical protein
MTDTSRTHRCIDCPQRVEHTPQELCPSCGRCKDHCHGIPASSPAAELEAVDVGLTHVQMLPMNRRS